MASGVENQAKQYCDKKEREKAPHFVPPPVTVWPDLVKAGFRRNIWPAGYPGVADVTAAGAVTSIAAA
ncbi:MAG TPA: hypothetical protein VH370_14065 [Humisphaera sp.]|jgi:hypothetical protein|nr:hypothetical protein [Humisphaera sp.]